MNITTYFSTDNVATTGLSPTVTIVKVSDDSVVVNAAAMTGLTNAAGWYKYNFTTFDTMVNYIVTADAGVGTVDDRYPTATFSADDILEDGKSQSDIIRIIAAALAGKVAVSAGGATYTGIDGSTSRIIASFDDDGNRTSITLDGE